MSRCRPCEWTGWGLLSACLAALVLLLASGEGHAAPPRAVRAAEVSPLWRMRIERESARYFGLRAQPARMAAQLHQESGWNPRAQSPYAQGLAQFTPATARWLPSVCPDVGPPDVWNPAWSIGAQSCYMAWLYERVPGYPSASPLTDCDRWAFALRAYNGGEKALLRERAKARHAGANPNAWREVEGFRGRASWAHTENIEYPQRILLRIEPAYLSAGWPGGPACR